MKINPILIIEHVKTTMYEKSQADHQLLEHMAHYTSINTFKNLENYFEEHKRICMQMKNAQYPRIYQEYLTVKFLLKFLRTDPYFQYVIQH